MLRALGVAAAATSSAPQAPQHSSSIGVITVTANAALSNSILSDVAEIVLIPPRGGVALAAGATGAAGQRAGRRSGYPLSRADLNALQPHGRATAVEAAVALVHLAQGAAPLAGLAALLLRTRQRSALAGRNWKGLLLERGGTLECTQVRSQGDTCSIPPRGTVQGPEPSPHPLHTTPLTRRMMHHNRTRNFCLFPHPLVFADSYPPVSNSIESFSAGSGRLHSTCRARLSARLQRPSEKQEQRGARGGHGRPARVGLWRRADSKPEVAAAADHGGGAA